MDWKNETVLQFLELYQMHPCIWDPKHPSHKNRLRLNEAWIDIQNNLAEPYPVKDLKRKRESLMSAYRAYRQKIKKSETTGDIYQPSWFAYSLMDSFLGTVYKCSSSFDTTEDDFNQQNVEDSNSAQLDDPGAGETYTFVEIETDPLTQVKLEQGSWLATHQPNSDSSLQQYSNQLSSVSQQASTTSKGRQDENGYRPTTSLQTSTTLKRRHDEDNPHDLKQTKKQMDQAISILKTMSQQQAYEEDECGLFGTLIAKKLRKLSEERKDLMMFKINELFYKECHERNGSNS